VADLVRERLERALEDLVLCARVVRGNGDLVAALGVLGERS
jgi:hypothetical protein